MTVPTPGIDADALLTWGEPRLRDLPWRRTRDPWSILVAEVMLQQTRVERVVPKWTAFLAEYHDPSACADASLGDVLRLWQGLGYPRRARALHACARVAVADHDGKLPEVLEELLALPGVGPYTARAVLAFAHERAVGVVDTNIARILARTAGERLTPKQAQAAADALVPEGDGWLWNQVMMDLGAAKCRPTPSCDDCPASAACAWHGSGRPLPDPATGSAGVSAPQAPYEGSDRQRRGDVLRRLATGPVAAIDIDEHILDGLRADGLVEVVDDRAILPR
jgi:A/G-specific adenine glycosylase